LDEEIYFRTDRSHKESTEHLKSKRTSNVAVIESIAQASKMDNLLEAQMLIDQARWQNWDNILLGRNEGLAAVLVYGLKLKLVNRYRQIGSPLGRDRYEQLKKEELPLSCNM
jgi:hypothetical protein